MDPTRSLAALFAALVGGCAALLPAASSSVPSPLVPAGETSRLRLTAHGVQIYECRRIDGAAASWLFVAPEARLVDERGQPAGSHGAGPHWQALDGSRIAGTVVAKVVPSDDSIPWLLLRTRSTGGEGRLSGISSVQRIHTRGGNAPAKACDDSVLGRTERVPYSAEYVFFEAKRS